MFKDFYHSFKDFFTYENKESIQKHCYYTWGNSVFEKFMIDFFQNLNPVKILKKEMILVELEDINQVLFIESGYYDIGFEINKKSKYVIRRSKSVIGHFELSFDKRSYFNMRVYQDCEGFFIRKRCWKSLT